MEEEQESFEQDKHCCVVGVFQVLLLCEVLRCWREKGSVSRYFNFIKLEKEIFVTCHVCSTRVQVSIMFELYLFTGTTVPHL